MDCIALDGLRFLAILGTVQLVQMVNAYKKSMLELSASQGVAIHSLLLIAAATCRVLNVFLSEVSDASKRSRKPMPAPQDWIQLL